MEQFSIPEKTKRLIAEILETKRISTGKYVRMFEDKFAELIGVREAVAVSSGTDADILALAVLHDFGANRGDEIVIPAISFVATGHAVVHAGFTPVFTLKPLPTIPRTNIECTYLAFTCTPV